MKTDIAKCGEIFRRGPGKFIFNCTFCTKSFDSKSNALDHIENHFQLFEISCTKQQYSVPDSGSIPSTGSLSKSENVDSNTLAKSLLSNCGDMIFKLEPSDGAYLDPLSDGLGFPTDHIKTEPELHFLNEIPPLEYTSLNKSASERKKKKCPAQKLDARERSNQRNVQCDICGNKIQRRSLFRHMRRLHSNLKKLSNLNSISAVICLPGDDIKKEADLNDSLETSHPIESTSSKSLPPKIQKKRGLAKKNRSLAWGPSNDQRIVQCDICGNETQKRNISRHMNAHANLKEFPCTICNHEFNNKIQLQRHLQIHSDFKKHHCHYCGARFHDRTNLVRHLRIHTGEKPYKCTVCDKGFAQSSDRVKHMRTHTLEKPYKCEFCNQSFTSSSPYISHKRRHTMDKRFVCDVCGSKFVCGSSLRDHMRMHTGERPFSCNICNNSFTRRSAYRQHINLHSGVKPYKCRFCDLTFAQGAGRRSHEKSVHHDRNRTYVLGENQNN